MTEYRELLIGCGYRRNKEARVTEDAAWRGLTTLDINPACQPDIVFDLQTVDMKHLFEDNTFDELHAYEVLEHLGSQGDWRFFFAQFSEFWRVLKPNGWLLGSVPTENSLCTWGDPGHTRILNPMTFGFLNQAQYTQMIGPSCMTDYRHWYKADFEARPFHLGGDQSERLFFALQAIKPSRISV